MPYNLIFNGRPVRPLKLNKMNKTATAVSVEKDAKVLYDLVDVANIFQVTTRTIQNWKAANLITFFKVGKKLYVSKKMLDDSIAQRGGVI